MARFEKHQYNQAIEACEKAAKFKGSRRHSEQWNTCIAREKE